MPDQSPIPVTVLSNATGGDGPAIQPGVVPTPGAQPNLIVHVITPVLAIVVRAIHTFLTILSGLVAAGMTGFDQGILPNDFLTLVWTSAGLSMAGTGVGVLKDLVTVFGKLEGKYPLLTGGV